MTFEKPDQPAVPGILEFMIEEPKEIRPIHEYQPVTDVYLNEDNSGIKFDQDKTRWELMPYNALEEIARVFTYGAKKYDKDNWRKGMPYRRIYGSLMRHLTAWVEGEDKDPETGISHLAHAGCNILFLLHYTLTGIGEDDRVKTRN